MTAVAGACRFIVVVAPSVIAPEVMVGGGGGVWIASGVPWPPELALNQPSVSKAPPPMTAESARMVFFFSAAMWVNSLFLWRWILVFDC
ncbi:hypothetical protein [Mycobacterium sp. 155]|uniref:hypothetical protein n=1 Tax=Mycobacterium sp. 155 TaxID=1157943 RepID=UPI00037CF69D|nr:hypothetical protein [Mycobacterium sp. 155]